MQSFSVQVAGSNVTSYVKRIEVWRKATEGIGRFSILLHNPDNALGYFSVDSDVNITVDNAVLMKGYVRRVQPILTHKEDVAVCEELEISGNDYGDNLLTWVYYFYGYDYPQMILSKFLENTELMCIFNGTPPKIFYDSKGFPTLLDMIREIAELIDYDFFVDNNKVLWMFPHDGSSNHPSSGITLKMVKGDTTNNIIKLVQYIKEDAYERRNVVVVRGPTVEDSWTEFNASDWEPGASGVTITDYVGESPTTPRAGAAALKITRGTNSPPVAKLVFPKYWLWYLDFSTCPQKVLMTFAVYNYRSQTSGTKVSGHWKVTLTDTDNNKISYFSGYYSPLNTWVDASVPLGSTVEIAPGPFELGHIRYDKWYYELGYSSFNWKVKEIMITGSGYADYTLIDALTLPIEIWAVSDQSGGGRKYILSLTKREITTQKELQGYADMIANKRKNPLESLTLWAAGDVGLIGGEWKWLPGYRVNVNIPLLNINNKEYRFMEVHNVIDRLQPEMGWIHRVECSLIPATVSVDTLRWSYVAKGEIAFIRALRDSIRAKEKELAVG